MAVGYEIIKKDDVERNILTVHFAPLKHAVSLTTLSDDMNALLGSMDNWCVRNECGWRESYSMFGFESD